MELTLDQALQKGIEAQSWQGAGYYTIILKAKANHPEANHYMGVNKYHFLKMLFTCILFSEEVRGLISKN